MEEQNLSDIKATFLDKLVSTGLGSGLSPVAPGTAGTVVGLLIYFIHGFEKFYVIVPAILVFFVWGTYAAGRMEKVYGHDPSRVVIDEIVAMWISLVFLPKQLILAAIGFFIFRMLDIFKPYPASYFDKKNGGIYIMLDDVVCGVYTNVILQLYLHFK
ncbi:MAG: phosphatidylglycerophosphatase A [Bacteroidetes bacterium]|nr:phosphatidylglycerophosphatase A [Bacteroidota bacterium]MCL5738980.1 phosphatidylglycerophosphatase A [Bacteroidota bacterium]